RAKLMCDDAHLYIAAELVEPRVAATIRQRDAQLYKEQAFEVFIDPGADGRDYLELQVNPLNTVCDLAMTRPYRDRGQADIGFDLQGFRSAVSVDGTANDASDEDRSWTVELAIPWAAMKALSDDTVAPPTDGQRWRINLARMRPADVDPGAADEKPRDEKPRDEKPRRDLWVWSAQGSFNMHLPERWGSVAFPATKRIAKP
ncbi:MAG: carbohydrate-binding family 9-like protein, partial [Tepidisphaeraceae bacterium]